MMELRIMFHNFANTSKEYHDQELLKMIPTSMNWIYISNVLRKDKEINNTNASFIRNIHGKKFWILNLKCIY